MDGDLMYYGNGTTWLREDGWAVYRVRTKEDEERGITFKFETVPHPVSKGWFSPVRHGERVAIKVAMEKPEALVTSVKFLGVFRRIPTTTPSVHGIEVLDRW